MDSKKKKLAIIGGASGALGIAAVALVVTLGFGKDEEPVNPEYNQIAEGVEYDQTGGAYDPNTYDPNAGNGGQLFEDGSTEEQGVFNPYPETLGVEATNSEEGEEGQVGVPEPPKPWFSLSDAEQDEDPTNSAKSMSKKVSTKAQHAYTNIISKINQDRRSMSANNPDPNAGMGQEPVNSGGNNTDNGDLIAGYESQFEELKQHTEELQSSKDELTAKLDEAEQKLSSSQNFEQMYMDLLASGNSNNSGGNTGDNTNNNGGDNNTPPTEQPVEPPADPNQNNAPDDNLNDKPEPQPTPQPTPQPQPNPNDSGVVTNPNNNNTGNTNVDTTPNDNKPKYVSKFSEIKHLTDEPVVVGMPTQFKHLDSLSGSYYALTTKSNTIGDHFADLLSKYTNQLLVKSMNYKRVEGYENVYKVTPVYLVNEFEVSAIKQEAKRFNDQHRSTPTKAYLKALADHIADRTEYGDKEGSPHSPYNIFTRQDAVCQAYTTYAKIYLDDMGLQNSIGLGTANNQYHAWNVITIDDKDLHYDFTWYDVTPRTDKYLGLTEQQISVDHKIEQVVKAVY
ncbi:MAG: hypothetical protein ABS904_00190 [Solibacillus isronensis]